MDWNSFIKEESAKNYFQLLKKNLEYEKGYNVYPPAESIFSAYKLTPFDSVKVVIVGQDPYHEAGQANGLAFSVAKGVKVPPSLRNIYKEIENDLGIKEPANNGDLTYWARQGVFLINATLTVREGWANSHKDFGWGIFTDKTIKKLNEDDSPKVFILWGNFAKSKKKFITNSAHLVLEAAHPSPLSANRGFFGCAHFSKANNFLEDKGRQGIDWDLNNSNLN